MNILVTGGAGFIGSALIRHLINHSSHTIMNVDKLTYAGNLKSLSNICHSDRYFFEHADICDADKMHHIFSSFKPDAIMHLAAESHVDRSISGPSEFMNTNIMGTYTLLEAARCYWQSLQAEKRNLFRFLHVSTDEVYGDLKNPHEYFTENTAYAPSSPYSASKASSDHLVRAWHRSYGLPVLITNCSNNYGPYQFPEKLIPLTIINALSGKNLTIYGDGTQVRDWLYVDDHVHALFNVLKYGALGSTYNIGGHNEKQNIEVVQTICCLLEELAPSKPAGVVCFTDLITYVTDRCGHDRRYAIDASKIEHELNWTPTETFASGMRATVKWYLNNQHWCQQVLNKTQAQSAVSLIDKELVA